MVWVRAVLKQQLDDGKVAAGTSQGEGSVVVVGGATVDLGALLHEELHRAQVAGSGSLHQGSAPTLRLMLLRKRKETMICIFTET